MKFKYSIIVKLKITILIKLKILVSKCLKKIINGSVINTFWDLNVNLKTPGT